MTWGEYLLRAMPLSPAQQNSASFADVREAGSDADGRHAVGVGHPDWAPLPAIVPTLEVRMDGGGNSYDAAGDAAGQTIE